MANATKQNANFALSKRAIARKERKLFVRELEKKLPKGWDLATTTSSEGYVVIFGSELSMCFRVDKCPVLSTRCFAMKMKMNPKELASSAVVQLKFDPAYRSFLVNKNMKKIAKETKRIRKLASGGANIPISETAKELEKEFDKLKTSV